MESFSTALEYLKNNNNAKVTRKGWNNENITISLQKPDGLSKMTKPYLYINKYDDKFPCDLSCESILAEDWILI